ncbi:MAG: glycosyltransferase family 39 protein [Pirellulales bacterium]|nr:glycosyltransferase family 39 protein [Pirellulales bacterium]
MMGANPMARFGALLLLALVPLYSVILILDVPLFDPDEGLHAAIAQEMVTNSDWVTPRFVGHAFWDKPPLYFWAQAVSLTLLGMNELAVRLPGLLFGMFGVATTGLLAWRWFGAQAGVVASFFQATTILPIAISQAAVHDVALVPFANLAIFSCWSLLESSTRRQRWQWSLALGVAIGLTCLTKGLLGIVCVAVATGGYALVTRQVRLSLFAWLGCAAIVAAAVGAPWYWMMEVRNPGYAYYYFVERHLLGFLTPTQEHGDAPWWYYLPILLGGGLPWIGYLPVAAVDFVRGRSLRSLSAAGNPTLLLWIWLVAFTLFLSAAHSKLVTYLLPVFPAISILTAQAWARYAAGELTDSAKRLLETTFRWSSIGSPLLLPICVAVTANRFDLHYSAWVYVAAFLLGFSSWLPIIGWPSQRIGRHLALGGGTLVSSFLFVMVLILPPIGATLSARDLAEHLNQLPKLPPRVLVAETRIGSVVFYLRPELRRQLAADQIRPASVSTWHDKLAAPPGALLAVPEQRIRKSLRGLHLDGLTYQQAGRYRVYQASDVHERIIAMTSDDDHGKTR